MNKKNIWVALIAALIILGSVLVFSGCNGNGPAETEPRVRGEAVDSEMVANKKFNMVVTGVTTADEFVADAEIRKQGDGISIKAYCDGTTTLTVTDWWGNTATAEVVVEGASIKEINVTPIAGNVANVMFFGVKPDDTTDDSKNIQKAIDSLKKTGGTVYFPAGKYIAKSLVLYEGINIRLQGKVEDVKSGYTNAVIEQVKAGEFAILDTQTSGIFNNFVWTEKGTTGASNISITGGMIDFGGRLASGKKSQIDLNMEGVGAKKAGSTGGIVFSCADNILIENVIFKDSYNSHAFQIAGVSNMTIKDCMFAGYMCRAQTKGQASSILTTRETIQIEYCHTGAFGASDETHFAQGEFYYCSNMKITGCYFGDSDTSGYQMVPIGQHGQNGTANVTNIEITDNVFDNPYISAVKCPNYCGVTMTGNTIISNVKGHGIGALIEFYTDMGQKTYAGKNQNGISITVISALPENHDGLHDLNISNNTFNISGESNKRAISLLGTTYANGAMTVSSKILQVPGQLYGKSYTGFVEVSNTATNITINNNTFNVSAKKYTDYIVVINRIIGFEAKGNTVNANGISYTKSYNGQAGFNVQNVTSMADANMLTMTTSLTSKYIIIPDGNGGTIKLAASSSAARKLILKGVDGMKMDITIDGDGNAVVNITCDNGKTFAGWKTASGDYKGSGTVKLSADLTLTAKIK